MFKTTSRKILFLILLLPVFAVGLQDSLKEKNVDEAFARGDVVCTGRIEGATERDNPDTGVTYFGADRLLNLKILGIEDPGYAPRDRHLEACLHTPDPEEDHQLRGWAWNDNLGFISFRCEEGKNVSSEARYTDCGGENYGVTMDGDGNLSGHAWNPAFGYIQFNYMVGGDIYAVSRNPDTYETEGYAWTQAGVYIDMSGIRIYLPEDEDPVYSCESDAAKEQIICMEIDKDPRFADGEDFYEIRLYLRKNSDEPLIGGNINLLDDDVKDFLKSIEFKWENSVKLDSREEFNEDDNNAVTALPEVFWDGTEVYFTQDNDKPELWTAKISSYAPTRNANISYTTSTDRPVPFFNEYFLVAVPGQGVEGANRLNFGGTMYTPVGEDRQQQLGFILKERGDDEGVIRFGKDFEFKPPVEINPFNVVDMQDDFSFLRGYYQFIRLGVEEHTMGIDYDVLIGVFYNDGEGGDIDFKVVDNEGDEVETIEKGIPHVFNKATSKNLLEGGTIGIIPLISEDGDPPSPTEELKLTVFTRIDFDYGGGNRGSYYSNKLPRLPGSIFLNPALIVHGAIQAHLDREISPDGVVDTSGRVNMRTGRETVDKNLSPYKTAIHDPGQDCVIVALKENNGDGKSDVDCNDSNYRYTKIRSTGEHILYFGGNDVFMKLQEDVSGQWIIVTEGGNIFIDEDIYEEGVSRPRLALVSLRSREVERKMEGRASGNVYIEAEVRGVQAFIMADGALFSYDEGEGFDVKTGEPSFVTPEVRAEKLSNQLIIIGAVSTGMNTLGGADWRSDRVLIGGRVPVDRLDPENVKKAQLYDLNYLRMFMLGLKVNEEGSQFDHSCERYLSTEERLEIATNPDHGIKNEYSSVPCEGIDITQPAPDGDLVPNEEKLSDARRSDTDYGPVYIYQAALEGDSVIFTR